MPKRRPAIARPQRGAATASPLAVMAFLVLLAVIGAAVLDVPAGLWSQPGLAGLRSSILGSVGIVTPQPALRPPTVTPQAALPPAKVPGAWYQVYFTTPRYPDQESDHQGGIDGHLVQLIDGAQRSVDVAAYELNLDTVAAAMLRAKGRGAAVRLAIDTDNLEEEAVQRLKQGGIPVVDDRRGAIMHDKFVVVDGRYLWTGSWNLTVNCTYRNNNNAILIDSPALARNYQAEFAEMFERHQFGPGSPSSTPSPQVTVDGTLIESYFAPEDHVAERIAAVVGHAQKSIRFMAFSFTDARIGQLLVERARAGVAVSGVVEKRGSEDKSAQYGPLRQAGVDVLQDGNPYVMHHKVIVVDESIVITGSFNFTGSADRDNDENVLIIHSPDVARLYLEEFQRVRQQASAAGES